MNRTERRSTLARRLEAALLGCLVVILGLSPCVALAAEQGEVSSTASGVLSEELASILKANVDFDALKAASENVGTSKLEIALEETLVDEYGNSLGEKTEQGNACTLVPGHTYLIDPVVIVEQGSVPCYLFAVMSDELREIVEIEDSSAQLSANGWICVDEDRGVWKYREMVDATTSEVTVPLMEDFTVKADWQPEGQVYFEQTFAAYAVGEDTWATTTTSTPFTSSQATTSSTDMPKTGDNVIPLLIILSLLALAASTFLVVSCVKSEEGKHGKES